MSCRPGGGGECAAQSRLLRHQGADRWRIGAVALTKGNLVNTSTGTLATINQLDPIRVEFSVASDSPILAAAQTNSSDSNFAVSLDLPDGAPTRCRPYRLSGQSGG